MRLFVSLFLVICALSKPISADKLDVAIANAIFSDTSPLCKPIDSHTTFSSVYTPSGSYWNFRNAEYEEDAFEIEMRHSDQNENRTWTMRLGKGGQVVSFIGPYGEVIPTQAQDKSAWNDLVTQPVAVSDDLNTPTNPYFIHGSGPYMKDEGMVSELSTLFASLYYIVLRTFNVNTRSLYQFGLHKYNKPVHSHLPFITLKLQCTAPKTSAPWSTGVSKPMYRLLIGATYSIMRDSVIVVTVLSNTIQPSTTLVIATPRNLLISIHHGQAYGHQHSTIC